MPFSTIRHPPLFFLKWVAVEAIKQATFNNYSEEGVIEAFNDNEGYYPIDGRFGIKLTEVTPLSFNDSELSVEIKEKGNNWKIQCIMPPFANSKLTPEKTLY